MKTAIFDALGDHESIRGTIFNVFKDRDEDYDYFKLEDMHILPCRSCGACGHKTPGECVINDDMPILLRAFAQCDVVVMLTPIRFGGYSSDLKKAVDKLMVVGMPFYIIKDGHMLHPMRYGSKVFLVIGISEKDLQGEVENFRLLVENNALNMLSSAKTLTFHYTEDLSTIEERLTKVLKEVYR